ncbi:MAG TPA: FG-GAP-like repeat-containing protein [Candidatus Methylomirabilis sp.]|nr:FG-GAP-like repeat-containing protein [Candidatus Methylomirabilis sp.]
MMLTLSLGARTVEAFGPEGEWVQTGPPALPTASNAGTIGTLVKLADGRVFQIGPQVRRYDPTTGIWQAAGALLGNGGVATVLMNGTILVTGLSAAEVYDPAAQKSTLTGAMLTPRTGHQATLLPTGDVLVSGGLNSSSTALVGAAEVYQATTGTWSAGGIMNNPRRGHTAILLPTGKVLAAGGSTLSALLTSAELYDSTMGTWTLTNSNVVGGAAGALLANGTALVVGTMVVSGSLTTASQTFDPSTGMWAAAALASGLGPAQPSALARLNDGRFLLIASALAGPCFTLETALFDPVAGTWGLASTPSPSSGNLPSLVVLPDGRGVLAFAQQCGPFKPSGQLFRPDNSTARLATTPTFVDFGNVPIGLPEQQTITVRNTGQSQLTGSALLAGAGFSLVSGSTYNIDPSGSSPTVVGFSSSTLGSVSGTVTIMSNGGWITVPLVATVVPVPHVLRDFDADGDADILWRHSSGVVFTWLMNGTTIHASGSPGGASTDWTIAGIGDFNGDGKADILWRHSSGAVVIWFMNGTTVTGTGSPGAVSTDWTIVGVGDFNGDGKADVLWRHSSGVLFIWFMDGANIIGTGSPGSATSDWVVAGVGDFNGDGKADILWRHSSGVVFVWLLNGATIVGSGSPGAITTDWVIQGVGDFNGDGQADILWRHTSGVVYIWLMNGTSMASAGSPGSAGPDWTIQGVADFNGDAFADILWRHTSGVVYLWLIKGLTVTNQGAAGSADSSWVLQ